MGRLHIPGGCYHVIGRGLERRYIFRETADKRDFLSRLKSNLPRSQSQCLAWAVMPNHYHLLIRAGPQPLSKLMAPLLGGYGGSYNRRHQRVGYVFQNRFKSILCDEENYLLELVRYIHLNPLRAGVVGELSELDWYPWTGHAGIVGNSGFSWHVVDEVLCHFGAKRGMAKRAYREFIRDGIRVSNNHEYSGGGLIRSNGGWEAVSMLRKEHSHCIGDERILGNSQFVEQSLSEDSLQIEIKTFRQQQGWTLEKLISCVCSAYEFQEQRLTTKARGSQLALAKSLICYWGGGEELGLPLMEIGIRLRISQQAVSKWVSQGRAHCRSGKFDLDSLC